MLKQYQTALGDVSRTGTRSVCVVSLMLLQRVYEPHIPISADLEHPSFCQHKPFRFLHWLPFAAQCQQGMGRAAWRFELDLPCDFNGLTLDLLRKRMRPNPATNHSAISRERVPAFVILYQMLRKRMRPNPATNHSAISRERVPAFVILYHMLREHYVYEVRGFPSQPIRSVGGTAPPILSFHKNDNPLPVSENICISKAPKYVYLHMCCAIVSIRTVRQRSASFIFARLRPRCRETRDARAGRIVTVLDKDIFCSA